jgi:single-strand DNA-binding protein
MAASLNKVMLMGNLTRDPELRFIPSGQGVTTFTIAVNRTYLSQSGEKKEEVSYIRIVVWGKRAEVCNEYLKKGSPVFVEGRLQSRSWEAQDGSKRSTIEVQAVNVQFLPRGGGKTSDENQDFQDYGSHDNAGANNFSGAPASDQDLQPDDEIPF